HNHYIDQLSFGQLRAALMAAAERLVAAGVIADREDVFWLRLEEITAALGAGQPASMVEPIAARRREHAERAKREPPPSLAAREHGLPTGILTRGATTRIKDGDWVVVDGTAGTVELGDE